MLLYFIYKAITFDDKILDTMSISIDFPSFRLKVWSKIVGGIFTLKHKYFE